ncbi:hypothetical protein C900_01997 [Fulvivirga imtechensis AK7]|uniref:Uncharacterized protein n=1 Tax=Fulvivirga imtechensis AK7 TaxID=1237149 RepID=L8JXP9_9BACT|nr:hypothetical protein [Fulvivirga imtechensis]ELR72002.1 hypothetical protein C900_01997 [Fulvivirga imtechensis AK7]
MQTAIHHFHIPVMGLAFTIDSPIKVARFGITSAVSIIEDNLVETMRKYYYQQYDEPYSPITPDEEDYRAKRITDYLNLLSRIVKNQFEKLKSSAFEAGSEIVKYFDMLPEDSNLKAIYREMMRSMSEREKHTLEHFLKEEMKPGAIEVNIMTKLDKNNYSKSGELIEDGSDALTALKGYAESELKDSAVIFSAGMNPRLFNYLEKFEAFDPKGWGQFDKKIIIKVSDFRSALIQGKYLAKKGIWVSEFRVESGLNCGGHAFATEGLLMGPILDEFKNRREELINSLFEIYNPAMEALGKPTYERPHPIKFTVQGGIGTHQEDVFLREYYNIDSTGWGTPFLLCPEATTVDEATLTRLTEAGEKDVVLSTNSPLGVRFNYLKGTSSDLEKRERIKRGFPGSPCTEKYLVSNTEFTNEPICTASRRYQKMKIEQLQTLDLPKEQLQDQLDEVLSKECLCIGLSNSVTHQYKIPFVKKLESVTICPGPNIAYFSKLTTLQEMTDHIYDRADLLENTERPHMFVKELRLYVNYIREQVDKTYSPDNKTLRSYTNFCENLLAGISYYLDLPLASKQCFSDNLTVEHLESAKTEVQNIQDHIHKLSSANQEA